MLQDVDHIEACCVFYVVVGTSNQLEQSKICVLNITTLGIAMLTVHHDMMFSICIMKDLWDVLIQTSDDVLSDEECTVLITQTRDFDGHSPRFFPVNRHTTSDQLGANRMTIGNPCTRQLCMTGFIMCRTCKLAVTHPILT